MRRNGQIFGVLKGFQGEVSFERDFKSIFIFIALNRKLNAEGLEFVCLRVWFQISPLFFILEKIFVNKKCFLMCNLQLLF